MQDSGLTLKLVNTYCVTLMEYIYIVIILGNVKLKTKQKTHMSFSILYWKY